MLTNRNRRDLKRRVCIIAAELLTRWLAADIDDEEDSDGIGRDDLTEAGRELAAELYRRGRQRKDGHAD